ncbi:hypothetical protein SLA2020_051470 [Shorea laevis]
MAAALPPVGPKTYAALHTSVSQKKPTKEPTLPLPLLCPLLAPKRMPPFIPEITDPGTHTSIVAALPLSAPKRMPPPSPSDHAKPLRTATGGTKTAKKDAMNVCKMSKSKQNRAKEP